MFTPFGWSDPRLLHFFVSYLFIMKVIPETRGAHCSTFFKAKSQNNNDVQSFGTLQNIIDAYSQFDY